MNSKQHFLLQKRQILLALWLVVTLLVIGVFIETWALPVFSPVPPVKMVFDSEVVVSEQVLKTPGAQLQVLVSGNKAEQMPVLLYFPDRDEEVSAFVQMALDIHGWRIVAANYRGFGKSTGVPSHSELQQDALALYDLATRGLGTQPQKVVVIGRGVGQALAFQVANQRFIDGLVLISPYNGSTWIHREYPWAPGWLLSSTLESPTQPLRQKMPIRVFAGEDDRLATSTHAERLANDLGADAQVRVFALTDHRNMLDNLVLWQALRRFIQDVERAP